MDKRVMIYLTIFAVMACAAPAIVYAQAGDGALSIANMAVSPQPVLVGSNVTITLQLYNSYTNELNNVNLYLSGGYPLLNSSPYDTRMVSSMGQGLYGGLLNYFTYSLHIPNDTPAGSYTMDLVAQYQTTTTTSSGVTSYTETVPAVSTMPIIIHVAGVPEINITATSTQDIQPGEQSVVTLSAINTGTDSASNLVLSVVNTTGFNVSGAYTFNIGTLAPQGTGTEYLTLHAARNISPGAHYIWIDATYSPSGGRPEVSKMVRVPLNVVLGSPDIAVSITGAVPPSLYPGRNQTLTLDIENIGTGTARNITLSMASDQNLTVGSSTSNIFVGSIAPGQEVSRNVFIIANSNDNKTGYSLPLSISYLNAAYMNQTAKTGRLEIGLQRIAIFNVTSVNASLSPGDTYVPVNFTIRNTGNEAAQQVVISLQTIYPVSPIASTAYLDSILPGQSKEITMYVSVDTQGSNGQYPITLYMQWTQPNGATDSQYTASADYYVTVSSGKAAQGSIPWYAIVVIIAAVAAAFYLIKMHSAKGSPKK
jgi:hypothetical protein